MKLLDTLTRAADEEQLSLSPLPVHAAAAQPEHLRRHYALLLAAVLTAQPTVSEARSRLLRLLLDALQLGDIRGALFDQARELAPEALLEAARLIREAGFAPHLLLDVLVLLRLDAPLDDETVQLVGELAAFLALDGEETALRAADAAQILGLDNSTRTPAGYATSDTLSQATLLARYWPGKLSHKLTADTLRAGLQGGLWLLDSDLDVDFPWQANGAILLFRNESTLNTFAKEGEIKISNCQLLDAAMSFQGSCSIYLSDCDWQGDYSPQARRTALDSQGQKLSAQNCSFSTRHARTINVNEAALSLRNCSFTRCGNAILNGGAVEHRGTNTKSIVDCRFDSCLGAIAGALKLSHLNGIERCEFISCKGEIEDNKYLRAIYKTSRKTSPKIEGDINYISNSFLNKNQFAEKIKTNTSADTSKESKANNIALHSNNYEKLGPIKNCTFRSSSVYIYAYRSEIIAENSQFISSDLLYGRFCDYGDAVAPNCVFQD